MVKRHDIHALAGPYALGALPDDERRLFEDHLRACDACRQEVRGLTETAARLGAAAAQAPPPGLRDRVMDEVGRTAQVPPVVTEMTPRRRFRWSTTAATWAAAACLAVAVAVGAFGVHAHRQADRLRAEHARVAAVLSAPDTQVTTSARTKYGRGMVLVSRSRDRMVFALSRARALPADRTYQIWYVSPRGTMRSAGLLTEEDDGARTAIAASVGQARQVGLTVEPSGGSPQPTMKPIMVLPLS